MENDVASNREQLKNKDEKLEAVLDFIQQERAERKVQDKLNFDVSLRTSRFKKNHISGRSEVR